MMNTTMLSFTLGMGYCAQYGSYGIMDLRTNRLLDIQPVSVSIDTHTVCPPHRDKIRFCHTDHITLACLDLV